MEIPAPVHILNSSSCQESPIWNEESDQSKMDRCKLSWGNFRMWHLKIKAPLHEWTIWTWSF